MLPGLALRYPIVLAPMAGGPSTPELAAAVSAAGGLGSLATGYLAPQKIREDVRRVRALTDRPFAANVLMASPVQPDPGQLEVAHGLLRPFLAEVGLADAPAVTSFDEPLDEQLQALLEERVPVLSFAFGIPAPEVLQAFKAQGTLLVGTATNVEEARRLEAAGVDAIAAQGSEAGGHRGTFVGDFGASLVGTMALVPQLVDAVQLPVIAAGGIMDGRGIVAALALGAVGVQMGTAFMLCPEAGTSAPHREALRRSLDTSTVVTPVFSGKHVRALDNRFRRAMAEHAAELPPYPVMNALTRGMRRAATAAANPDLMGMWAGQASPLAQELPAARLIERWMAEVAAVKARL